jgi:hypothetical protein
LGIAHLLTYPTLPDGKFKMIPYLKFVLSFPKALEDFGEISADYFWEYGYLCINLITTH